MSLVFLGGYTRDIPMASGELAPGRSRGIACCRLDRETGRLSPLSVAADAPNPSYLAPAPSGKYLYCVNELETVGDAPGSMVSAYALCGEELRLLGRRLAAGPLACHAVLSPEGRHLLAASYNGGVCVLPVEEDHTLGEASCAWGFQGRGRKVIYNPEGGRAVGRKEYAAEKKIVC